MHFDLWSTESVSLYLYKIQLTQKLKPADWALEQIETDSDFAKKITFSDEARFWIDGITNK